MVNDQQSKRVIVTLMVIDQHTLANELSSSLYDVQFLERKKEKLNTKIHLLVPCLLF
jgi:hypothetical protein